MINVDMSDLEHGLGVLFEATTPEERIAIASKFLHDLKELDASTSLDDFTSLLAPVALMGDIPSPSLRDVFTQLVITYSGWSASQLILMKQKQKSREHGKKGGQPKSKFIARDQQIIKEFNEIKSRGAHSNTEVAKRMVYNEFVDINGKSLSVPQICRIVRNHKSKK